jgi:hypothetical protein
MGSKEDHQYIETPTPQEHIMKTSNTTVIAARELKLGDRIHHPQLSQGMRVQRVTTCPDGSLRIVTDVSEQRMTAFIAVRVVH